jgi:hypothetical protein
MAPTLSQFDDTCVLATFGPFNGFHPHLFNHHEPKPEKRLRRRSGVQASILHLIPSGIRRQHKRPHSESRALGVLSLHVVIFSSHSMALWHINRTCCLTPSGVCRQDEPF